MTQLNNYEVIIQITKDLRENSQIGKSSILSVYHKEALYDARISDKVLEKQKKVEQLIAGEK